MNRITSAAIFALTMIAWIAVMPRMHVTTAITHFLPESEDRRVATLARSLAESAITSTMTLSIAGASPEELVRITKTLVADLGRDPRTQSARSGFDEADFDRVIAPFAGRQTAALVPAAELDEAGIRTRIESLRSALASPKSPLVRALGPIDPLGGVASALDAFAGAQGKALTSREGVLLSVDEAFAFAFVATKARAFDAPEQRRYLEDLDRAFERAKGSSMAKLEISGVARFAIASEAQIRGDVERIGVISTVGILVLFALFFRSLRLLALGMVPLLFGSAAAIIASHFVFGEIHGLTIAFGTSLLGVGIDYAEHYFTHFALEPEQGAAPIMNRVWPGLWLGALTTLIGFVGLGFTGFPGIREIAFFSAVAIAFALLGTRFLLPPWMPARYAAPRLPARLASLVERCLVLLQRQRLLPWLPLVIGAVAALFVTRVRFVDDMSALLALDPALVAEDARVRDRVTSASPGKFVIVVDADEHKALEKLDRTTRALEGARREGMVLSFVPLGAWIRSPNAQAESFAKAQAAKGTIARILDESGFRTEAFAPFFATLEGPTPKPVTLAEVVDSPLGRVIETLAPRLPEGRAFVMPLGGVRDMALLRARLPDAVVVDEASLLSETYARVRKETTRMLAFGVVLVLGTLVVRYRSLRLSMAALAPALLAATCTVAFFAIAGIALTLLHVVALLLVLSMGADFGIFVVEGRASLRETAQALVSVFTATTTTLLSFGLLALSPSPALRALGVTITLGLTLSFLFCPSAWVLWGLSRPRPRPKKEAKPS